MEKGRKKVKKAFIVKVLLALILMSSAFCDPSPNITFGFKVLNTKNDEAVNVPDLKLYFYNVDWKSESGENVNAGRFAQNRPAIQEMNVDNTKDLSTPQVIVAFETRYIYSFYFWLRFSPMTSAGSNFKGMYDATVYEKIFYDTYQPTINNSEMLVLTKSHTAHQIEFSSEDPIPVELRLEFPAMSSRGENATGRERWMYPIAFAFSDYLSSYPAGEYTASITVEVNSL